METSSSTEIKGKTVFNELAVGSLTYYNLFSLHVHDFLDLISFCMLVKLIPDESMRQLVNKSRITHQFWKLLKTKYYEHMSSSLKSIPEDRLLKTYKYIYYFKCFKNYDWTMVAKAFFIVKGSGLLSNSSKMADIDKQLTKYLKNITTQKKFSRDLLDLNRCSLDELILEQMNVKTCSQKRNESNQNQEENTNKISDKYLDSDEELKLQEE